MHTAVGRRAEARGRKASERIKAPLAHGAQATEPTQWVCGGANRESGTVSGCGNVAASKMSRACVVHGGSERGWKRSVNGKRVRPSMPSCASDSVVSRLLASTMWCRTSASHADSVAAGRLDVRNTLSGTGGAVGTTSGAVNRGNADGRTADDGGCTCALCCGRTRGRSRGRSLLPACWVTVRGLLWGWRGTSAVQHRSQGGHLPARSRSDSSARNASAAVATHAAVERPRLVHPLRRRRLHMRSDTS
jgi:hypothetical protein